MPARKTFEFVLFLTCWFAFAWFNQGGGWNQNSRFGEVRAIVEEGRFAIDDFFVYLPSESGDDLARVPVERAEYDFEGKRHRLCWVDSEYSLFPVGERPIADGVEKAPMIEKTMSGDVAYVEKTGHFHPNKPPGTSFLALPAYFVIYHVERELGINPDHWWTLNINAWLTTIFSVGLLSAFGCVLFFRLACEFAGGEKAPALLATFAFAFGTTFFPFGTLLFDHNLTAVLLLASFYWLRGGTARPVLAGFCAGFAVVTNYVAGGAVIALGLFALFAGGINWRRALLYALGGFGPALLLGAYHTSNFGSPFALANDFQNPLFKDPSGSLGMFMIPHSFEDVRRLRGYLVYVGGILSISPYRGVFWLAPVLVLGVVGWIQWVWKKTWFAEAILGLAIFGWFFLVNVFFNGYHGGFSAGPRYLVPGLPFLALPMVVGFARWKRTALVLLAVSLAQQFLLVATDAQNCLAVGGHARVDDKHRKDDFYCNIVTEYAAPLFFTGRDGPLIEQLLAIKMEKEEARISAETTDLAERDRLIARMRAEMRAAVDRHETQPILLASIDGPVSVNVVNVFDGLLGYGVWPIHSPQCDWASFNAGELLWPKSRVSLLPLLLIVGGLVAWLLVMARRV